jgi:uncharacterized membrane protein YkvI
MKKSLTWVLVFYVLLVCASIAFADTNTDALCAGQQQINNIALLVQYLLPGGIAVLCIVTGIMLIRKEHMGSGIAIITAGVIGNILLAAILIELAKKLKEALVTICTAAPK